jgi:type II restriction enzyme
MRFTAQQVYDALLNEDKILELQGQIQFNMGDISIVVKQKDVVGNIMQEWLQGWFDRKGIDYAVNENTQMPPDFFLNPDDKTKELLEVKAFNRKASPGFDIADFRMYEEEIIQKPYMLNVDYLIFEYDMSEDGIVKIVDIWLKKVWQITRRMKDWPINLQIKNNVVHKIRPAVWYSNSRTDYVVFERLEDFVSAIEETVYQNPKTREEAGTWKQEFLHSYELETGQKLDIPRWIDIMDKYDVKKQKLKNKSTKNK